MGSKHPKTVANEKVEAAQGDDEPLTAPSAEEDPIEDAGFIEDSFSVAASPEEELRAEEPPSALSEEVHVPAERSHAATWDVGTKWPLVNKVLQANDWQGYLGSAGGREWGQNVPPGGPREHHAELAAGEWGPLVEWNAPAEPALAERDAPWGSGVQSLQQESGVHTDNATSSSSTDRWANVDQLALVNVIGLNGTVYKIGMHAQANMRELKEAILRETGVPLASQQLLIDGACPMSSRVGDAVSDDVPLSDAMPTFLTPREGEAPCVTMVQWWTFEHYEWLRFLEQADPEHGFSPIPECVSSKERGEQAEFFRRLEQDYDQDLVHDLLLRHLDADEMIMMRGLPRGEFPDMGGRLRRLDQDVMFHRLLHPGRDVPPDRNPPPMLPQPELNAMAMASRADRLLLRDMPGRSLLRQVSRSRLGRLSRDPAFYPLLVSAREFPDMIPSSIWAIPEWLLTDEVFVQKALLIESDSFRRLRPWFLIHVWPRVRESARILKVSMQLEPWCVVALEPKLLHDRDLLLLALETSGDFLQLAAPDCQNDKDVVMSAVQQHGAALKYASIALRADHEVVLAAVSQKGSSLEFADTKLKDDRTIVATALQLSPLALQHASSELRSDRGLVLMAVQQIGTALQYAGPDLQQDREIVTIAIRQSAKAFKFASQELHADREIVLIGLQQSAWALDFASPDLRADDDLRGAAIRVALGRNIAEEISLKGCFQLLAQVVNKKGLSLDMGPLLQASLVAEPSIAVALVQKDPHIYRDLDDDLRANKDVALASVQANWRMLTDVPFQTRNFYEIQMAAVRQNRTAFHFILPTDRKRLLDALEQLGDQ